MDGQLPNQKKSSNVPGAWPPGVSRGNLQLYAALTLSFLLSFILYLLTLAPTVTFEDSGELIAAAYNLGVPHQPGYPLFTLLGRIFSMIPLENVAYRLNLMSAFLSSLAALFLTWAAILLIEEISAGNRQSSIFNLQSSILKHAAALAAGLLLASAYENWEQAIITEVYGLNTLSNALVIWLAVMWRRQAHPAERERYFLLICYVLGLAFSNHTTSLVLLPVLIIFALLADRRFLLRGKRLLAGAGALILGLLPYLYLPIASARNPKMDWGNPENWDNFIRTVTRHQYGFGEGRTFAKFLAQFGVYLDLLREQWFPLVLIFALPGLIALFKYRRIYAYFLLVFFLFTAPLTTYLTDFDVSVSDPFAAAENRALVSVFYIPSYLCLALLMGLGMFYTAALLMNLLKGKRLVEYGLAGAITLLPLALAHPNYQKLDMSRYRFAEDYAENLFRVTEKNALVIVNWDPFYFPLNYYQFVEGRRADLLVLDQELLRRSWYIQWLKDHYPELVRSAARETEEFLAAVAPFENQQPYDGNFIQAKYLAMTNAFIDRAVEAGREVYIAVYLRPLPPGIAARYNAEPLGAAFRLRKNASPPTPLALDSLQFRHFFDDSVPKDRMAKVFQNYYGTLMLNRGQYLEQLGEKEAALTCYLRAVEFLREQPQLAARLRGVIERLRQPAEAQ